MVDVQGQEKMDDSAHTERTNVPFLQCFILFMSSQNGMMSNHKVTTIFFTQSTDLSATWTDPEIMFISYLDIPQSCQAET